MHGNVTTDRATPPNPIRRQPGTRLPCGTCPKFPERDPDKSPMAGALRDLSPRNQQTVQAYYEARGANLPAPDPLAARRFGIIERVIQRSAYRQRQTAADLLTILLTRAHR